MQPTAHPQVPGDSDRDANDGRQVPRGVRGEKNLRVAVSNHQTTFAMPMDADKENDRKNDEEQIISNQATRYNLRRRKIISHNKKNSTKELTENKEVLSSPISSSQISIPSPTSSIRLFDLYDRPSSSSTISDGSEDVVQMAPAVKTAPTTGQNRTRKKWSSDMNKFIWRTYLVVTEIETKIRGHLDILYKKFTDQYPNFDVSKQRIGDQRRAIVRNKLLPQNILDEIKEDVKKNSLFIQTRDIFIT